MIPRNQLRSPLRRFGGKAVLAERIAAEIGQPRVWVELYAGSCEVTLAKDLSATEVINDLDGAVVNLFRVLRCPTRAFALANALELTPYAREEWESCRDYDAPELDEVERARRFLVCSWQTHGHRPGTRAGWRNDGPLKTQRGGSVANVWAGVPERVRAVVERLRHVQIEHQDARKLAARFRHPDVTLYADPPYPASVRVGHDKYYVHDMPGDAEHVALLEVLRAHPGHVLVSGYDCDLYRETLRGWSRAEFGAYSENAGERTEVLWSNRPLRQSARQLSLFGA